MTTRCFHVALHTNLSETKMTATNPPGEGYAMVSPASGLDFVWRLLAAVLPAPSGEGLTLMSNGLPEPEWVQVPQVHVSEIDPGPSDGVDGDIWIKH